MVWFGLPEFVLEVADLSVHALVGLDVVVKLTLSLNNKNYTIKIQRNQNISPFLFHLKKEEEKALLIQIYLICIESEKIKN